MEVHKLMLSLLVCALAFEHKECLASSVSQKPPVDVNSQGKLKPRPELPQPKELSSRPKMSCYVCNTGPGDPQDKCRLAITDQALTKTIINGYNVTLNQLLQRSHSPSTDNFTQQFFLTPQECNEGENYCTTVTAFKVVNKGDKPETQYFATDRRCSKICSDGCLVIGERNRTKSCSQCCKEPKCNSSPVK